MFIRIIKGYISTFSDMPKGAYFFLFLNLLNAVSIGFSFFISIYFESVLKLDVYAIGILMSCYGAGTIFGSYLSGKCCDFFSEEKIAILNLCAQSLGFFLLSKINSIIGLALNLWMLGFATFGFKSANNLSLLKVCNISESMRLKAMNISHVALNFGFGISGVIMGLVSNQSFEKIFYLASIILWCCAFLQILNIFFSSLITKQHFSGDQNNDVTLGDGKESPKIFFSNIKTAKVFLMASIFLMGLVIAQLSSTYPIYIKNQLPHYGMKAVSFLFLLDTIIIVLFQSSLPRFYSKIPTLLIMGLGALMTGLGTFVLIFTNHLWIATFSCICWTLGEMLFIPTSASLSYDIGEENKKGASMGLFQSSFALSKVVGPSIGSAIYDILSPSILWFSTTVMTLGIFFIAWLMMCYQSKSKSTLGVRF